MNIVECIEVKLLYFPASTNQRRHNSKKDVCVATQYENIYSP